MHTERGSIERSGTSESAPPSAGVSNRQGQLLALGALFVAVFLPTVEWLIHRWSMGAWYQSHGVIIPFVTAYLIRRELTGRLADVPAAGSLAGLALLAGGLVLHAVDSVLGFEIVSAFALIVSAIGLFLALEGWPRTRALWFPFALLFAMLPLPSMVIQPVLFVLRKVSAFGTEQFMHLIQVPVVRQGTELIFATTKISIVDACSGFSTLSATVAFACILLYLQPMRIWRSIAFVAAAFPVALFANVLRCSTLSLLAAYVDAGLLETRWHEASGYAAYGVGLGIQLTLQSWLRD